MAFPCENMGMNSTDIQERVRSCANEFAMEHLMDRSIFKLSGGEKQKIAFATACMLHQSYWSLMSRPVTWITKQYRNYMI